MSGSVGAFLAESQPTPRGFGLDRDAGPCIQRIPGRFLTPGLRDALVALAAELPSVPTAGVEIDLRAETVVGLAARVTAGSPQRTWLARAASSEVRALVGALASPSTAGLDGVWLEFDAQLNHSWSPPRIFVDLDGVDPERTAGQVLSHLEHPLSIEVVNAKDRALALLGPGWRILQVGWQVGLPHGGRLCVRPRGWPELCEGLQRVLPPAIAKSALEWCDRTRGCVDEVDLAFDVSAGGLLPKVGLEWQFGGWKLPEPEERWEFLVGSLDAPGGVRPEHWAALRPWFGFEIHDLGPPIGQTALQRGFSHFKTVISPDGSAHTKVYLGWSRELRPALRRRSRLPDPNVRPPTAQPVLAPGPTSPGLVSAMVEQGLRYLGRNRDVRGWWRDFHLASGPSDEWVTAYVGHALLGLAPHAVALELASSAWLLLADRRRFQSGWGFNALLPVDADSTAWAVRLAIGLGHRNHPRIQPACDLLRLHGGPGGIRTYGDDVGLARHMGWPTASDYTSWMQPRPDVTANALGALGDDHLADVLEQAQEHDGHWEGYWWSSSAFPTWLAVDALSDRTGVMEQAARWSGDRLGEAPTAFELACLLAIQARAHKSGAQFHRNATSVLPRLASLQQPDGSWPPGADLRVPLPTEPTPTTSCTATPGDIGSVTRDLGVFTTATVLWAVGELIRAHR